MAPARPPYFEAARPRSVAIQLLISIVCIIGEALQAFSWVWEVVTGKCHFYFQRKLRCITMTETLRLAFYQGKRNIFSF